MLHLARLQLAGVLHKALSTSSASKCMQTTVDAHLQEDCALKKRCPAFHAKLTFKLSVKIFGTLRFCAV